MFYCDKSPTQNRKCLLHFFYDGKHFRDRLLKQIETSLLVVELKHFFIDFGEFVEHFGNFKRCITFSNKLLELLINVVCKQKILADCENFLKLLQLQRVSKRS